MHELDLTATVVTGTDQGIDPVIQGGDLAGLDWKGVEFVEEDWRPAFDGTFSRTRFYRHAKWIEKNSTFHIYPVDAAGTPVGDPILEIAGKDDQAKASDDGFVRRFVARQVTHGCPAIGDCSGVSQFIAQALVQVRYAQNADERARPIPASATGLEVAWTADPGRRRYVPIAHKSFADTPYRYGFEVDLEMVNPPQNGQHYVPGEALDIRVTFRDGEGNRLHPEGSLPSYLDFASDAIDSGLRHYDGLQELLTLYYALKHREGLMIWSVAGPTDHIKFSHHEVGVFDFFLPQTVTATVAEDGYTALSTLHPSMAMVALPELWSIPAPDTVHFVLPEDALPGTYVISTKARRDWGGEAQNRGATLDIQVGQKAPTVFAPTTGHCNDCHQGPSALGNVLHGLGDRRACAGCHAKLGFEPDHALDYRIHLIHSRSERVQGDVYDCATCHLTPPSGAPRGFPGIGPY